MCKLNDYITNGNNFRKSHQIENIKKYINKT